MEIDCSCEFIHNFPMKATNEFVTITFDAQLKSGNFLNDVPLALTIMPLVNKEILRDVEGEIIFCAPVFRDE